MQTAVIYARYSPRPGVECDSINHQVERCRAYCAAHGMRVTSEWIDSAISGKSVVGRAGLQSAMEVVCSNKSVLVVYSLSRLARSIRDAINIADKLRSSGAGLAMITEAIDTSTPQGALVFHIFAALAEFERAQIAQRTSDAMRSQQARGIRMSHRCPYGYEPDPGNPVLMVPVQAEQEAIKQILLMHGSGKGLREMCRELDSAGTSCRGGRWQHTTIRAILRRAGVSVQTGKK